MHKMRARQRVHPCTAQLGKLGKVHLIDQYAHIRRSPSYYSPPELHLGQHCSGLSARM